MLQKFAIILLILINPLKAMASSAAEFANNFFGLLNEIVGSVIFFNVFFFREGPEVPLAVVWLVIGAIVFTLKTKFINVRAFKHAIDIVRGKFDDKTKKYEESGEVSHFQALTTALSATVGLGNIAGVAVAISIGGPGATFWMIIAGFIGMSSKFTECTLAQMYKITRADGNIMGGPMEYLSHGLKDMGYAKFGKVLAAIFAVLCIGGSFGGGGSFQVNQSL